MLSVQPYTALAMMMSARSSLAGEMEAQVPLPQSLCVPAAVEEAGKAARR